MDSSINDYDCISVDWCREFNDTRLQINDLVLNSTLHKTVFLNHLYCNICFVQLLMFKLYTYVMIKYFEIKKSVQTDNYVVTVQPMFYELLFNVTQLHVCVWNV